MHQKDTFFLLVCWDFPNSFNHTQKFQHFLIFTRFLFILHNRALFNKDASSNVLSFGSRANPVKKFKLQSKDYPLYKISSPRQIKLVRFPIPLENKSSAESPIMHSKKSKFRWVKWLARFSRPVNNYSISESFSCM